MGGKEHWQSVYSEKASDKVSWYRPHLDRSLEFIRSCGMKPESRIVDVGGGASTLVDDLLADGFHNLAVIDIAEAALEVAKNRLGERAAMVDWIVGDVTTDLLAHLSLPTEVPVTAPARLNPQLELDWEVFDECDEASSDQGVAEPRGPP